MDLLIYIANALYLTAYFVRDMLLLRLFSLLAALSLVGYFATRTEVLGEVIAWNVVFATLNLVQLLRLARPRLHRRRRRHALTDGAASGGG